MSSDQPFSLLCIGSAFNNIQDVEIFARKLTKL
jgi:hypothetical protein